MMLLLQIDIQSYYVYWLQLESFLHFHFKIIESTEIVVSSVCFISKSMFMLDETKLVKKEELLIFFNAILASDGIFGDSSIIFNAKSLTEEINASEVLFF